MGQSALTTSVISAIDDKVRTSVADPSADFLDSKVDGTSITVDGPSQKIQAEPAADFNLTGQQQGTIAFFNGVNWTVLTPGTNGQVLKTQGAGANPLYGLAEDLLIAAQQQGSILFFDGTNWIQLAPGTAGQVLKTQGAGSNPIYGLPEDLSISGQTNGSVIYFNGTNWVHLSPGTAGQLLQSNGAAAPTWVDPPSSGASTAAFLVRLTGQVSWDESGGYDIGNNFASNTFTAPVSGRYLFCVCVEVQGFNTDTTHRFQMTLSNPKNSAVSGLTSQHISSPFFSGPIRQQARINTVYDLNASQTVTVSFDEILNYSVTTNNISRSYWSGAFLG